jgi:hypothetical protein
MTIAVKMSGSLTTRQCFRKCFPWLDPFYVGLSSPRNVPEQRASLTLSRLESVRSSDGLQIKRARPTVSSLANIVAET